MLDKMEGAVNVLFDHPNSILLHYLSTQILKLFTFRKLEGLGEEGSGILAKMEGAETADIAEQNQILMMLLKASCEVPNIESDYLLVIRVPYPAILKISCFFENF